MEACTDTDATPKPPWRARKEAYVVHNVRAILADFREVGNTVFQRFNPEAGRDGTLWYYGELAALISARSEELGDERVKRLSAELQRVVATLRSETGRLPV